MRARADTRPFSFRFAPKDLEEREQLRHTWCGGLRAALHAGSRVGAASLSAPRPILCSSARSPGSARPQATRRWSRLPRLPRR